uniref:Ribosomal protein L2 n=1 Tax=Physarum polycephalum TaxID=5791 RepID=F2Y9U3_PHYPO|nr:ribosomal protein L2 [Physarum polycephalum]
MNQISYASAYHFFDILQTIKKVNKIQSRIKPLSCRLKSKGGRFNGQIIHPRRGDYSKRIYRYIDFKRNILPEYKALVCHSLYDPNRSANICLVCYPVGIFSYILQPTKLHTGDVIINLSQSSTNFGDSLSLQGIPSGRLIHNIQGKFTRAAGCSTILIRKDFDQALTKLKSGELRFFHTSVIASLGCIGNENHFLRNYKYAGTIRRLGKRPRTRPSSMNPVDHPMGGRTRGGVQPMNRKGIITLHRKTVKKHHPSILYTKRQLKLLRL